MAIPDQVVGWAKAAQAQTGCSDLAAAGALAVSLPESRYNPGAIGDNGSSYGLTQLHQGGGLGDGYATSTLLDPVQNFAIAQTNIQASLDRNGGDLYAALRPWSTRDLAYGAGTDDALAALGASPGAAATSSSGMPTSIGGALAWARANPLLVGAIAAAAYLLTR